MRENDVKRGCEFRSYLQQQKKQNIELKSELF